MKATLTLKKLAMFTLALLITISTPYISLSQKTHPQNTYNTKIDKANNVNISNSSVNIAAKNSNINIQYINSNSENEYIVDIRKDSFEIINDEGINYIHGYTVYPKQGFWSSPFIAIDSGCNIDQLPIIIKNNPYTTVLDGSLKITDSNNRTRHMKTIIHLKGECSINSPCFIKLTKYKDCFIIFGDQANPKKSYVFDNGRITQIELLMH